MIRCLALGKRYSGLRKNLIRTVTPEVEEYLRTANIQNLKKFLREHQSHQPLFELLYLKTDPALNQPIFKNMHEYSERQLALGLNFIAMATQKIRSKIIPQQHYKALLRKYFEKVGPMRVQSASQLLALTRFIYLQDNQLLNFIKLKQVTVIEAISKQKEFTAMQFQAVISPHLFNITDMPLIYQLLYEVYFPSLSTLANSESIHRVLIYLSKFAKMPFFLPKLILNVLQQKMHSQTANSFGQFLQMANIIYLMLFNFPATLQEQQLTAKFQKLHRVLLEKCFFENLAKKDKDQDNKGKSSKLLYQLQAAMEKERIKKYKQAKKCLRQQISDIEAKLSQKPCEDYFVFNALLIKRLKQFKSLLNMSAHRRLRTQFKLKQARIVIAAASSSQQSSDIMCDFLSKKQNAQFFDKNVCLPTLHHTLAVAVRKTQEKQAQRIEKSSEQFQKLCLSVKNKLDEKGLDQIANLLEKEVDGSQELEQFSCFQDYESLLWSKDIIEKIMLLQENYQVSTKNVLLLLKNDPLFLVSLLKWNSRDFLNKHLVIQSFKPKQPSLTDPLSYTLQVVHPVCHQYCISFSFQSELTKNLSSFNLSKSYERSRILQGNLSSMIKAIRRSRKAV